MKSRPEQAADASDENATASAPRPLPMDGDPPALSVGPYRLIQRVGGDEVADIYRGYDASLDRPVAIRLMNHEFAGDEDLVRRFHAEATAAAGINHPNVVAIHFVGRDAGRPYYVMHFVEGESLASRLARQECLAPDVALEITRQCLAGLEAAHQRGIVHRGLHPGKILLEEPTARAVVIDLGRLRHAAHDARTDLATVLYTPPEAAHGAAPNARSDLYAMGVVLYRMLAGRMPFEAQSPVDVLYQITYGVPLSLEETAPNVPAEIRTIVQRLMARDPAERYQTASDALADVQAACKDWADGGIPWTSATSAIDPASDEEFCQSLLRLTGGKPWQRLRDWAATMFRRHAPEFVEELQNTTQQADGAIAHYERRCDRLAALVAEGEQVAAELTEPSARAMHQEQLDALRTELSQAQDTLDALRRQREVLIARLQAAQRGLPQARTPVKLSRRAKVLAAVAAGLLSLLVVERIVLAVLAVITEIKSRASLETAENPVVEPRKPAPIMLPTAPPADLMSQNFVYFSFEPDSIVPSGPYLVVRDLSGREQHGVLVGPRQFDEGRVGKALVFPDTGLRIDLSTLNSMAWNREGKPISVSVWIRQSRYTKKSPIFNGLMRRAENRSITFEATSNGEKVEARDVSAEQWHHLVGVWNGLSTALYVDGRLADSRPTKDKPDLRIDSLPLFGREFCLGSIGLYGYHEPGFIGLMDEFALFERPLFEEEVQTLYRLGIQGQRPPLPAKPVSLEGYSASLDDYYRGNDAFGLSLDGKTKIEIGHWGRIWQSDIATGQQHLHPQLPADGVTLRDISFSSDGRWAAMFGWSGSVSLWDLRERKIGQEFRTPLVAVYVVAFSPDMTRIAIGGKVRAPNQDLAAVGIWDLATGKLVREFRDPVAEVRAVAYSPDGKRLLVAQRRNEEDYDLNLCLLRADDGQTIRNLAKCPLGLPCLRWLPDSARVLVGGIDATVRLFDVNQGQEEIFFRGERKISHLELVAGGQLVIGTTEADRAIFWSMAGKVELGQCAVPKRIRQILFADPKTLTVLTYSGAVERVAVPAAVETGLSRAASAAKK